MVSLDNSQTLLSTLLQGHFFFENGSCTQNIVLFLTFLVFFVENQTQE